MRGPVQRSMLVYLLDVAYILIVNDLQKCILQQLIVHSVSSSDSCCCGCLCSWSVLW